MIQLYYGEGKGKSTAACGAALRYSQTFGSDKVYFFQFLKNGTSSELKGLEKLGIKTESDPNYAGFVSEVKTDVKQSYIDLLAGLMEKMQKDSMMVLDEMLDMYCLGVYTKEHFALIFDKARQMNCELVITGHCYRGASVKPIIKMCDYVSRIDKEKHPFDKNVQAREGIEY